MIEYGPITGLATCDWNEDPKGDDVTNLRTFLRSAAGQRFLEWMQVCTINAAFSALTHPNSPYACGYGQGIRQAFKMISDCGLTPAERPAPSEEELKQAKLLSEAGLEHFGL